MRETVRGVERISVPITVTQMGDEMYPCVRAYTSGSRGRRSTGGAARRAAGRVHAGVAQKLSILITAHSIGPHAQYSRL